MDTLLDTGKYSDLSLHCKGKTWKVHRAFLCTSSSVFAATVDSGFKEAQSYEIHLPDDEPEIVEKMLRFLYLREYNDERDMDELQHNEDLAPTGKANADPILTAFYPRPARFGFPFDDPPDIAKVPNWSEKSLLVNVQVYIIADKNDIGTLKKRATEKFTEVVGQLWDTPSFCDSAKLLYDNTPRSDRLLRDVVAETAKKNILTLIDKQDFEELMVDHGDLAVDVLKSVLLKGEEVDSNITYGNKKSRKKGSREYGF